MTNETREQRIKELEDALADMITATVSDMQPVMHSILYDSTSSAQEKVIEMKKVFEELTSK